MADLKKIADDLIGLAKEDVQALGEILKNDYNAAVKVVHDDLLGTGGAGDPATAAPADSTGPGTGPGH